MELIVKIVILYTAVNQLFKDSKLFIHYLSLVGQGQVKLVSALFNGIRIVKVGITGFSISLKQPKLQRVVVIFTIPALLLLLLNWHKDARIHQRLIF
jgi:hypothetical protein